MTDRIDISAPTKAICEALGLEPASVKRLNMTPTEVVADVFLKNENGSKYINADGVPAVEVHSFEVST